VTAAAAFVRSGDWIDEIRPSDHESRSPWIARAVPLVTERNRGGLGLGDHSAAEFLREKLGFEQSLGGLGFEVAQAFIESVRRRQAAAGAPAQLIAIELAGPADAVASLAREPFAEATRPLGRRGPGLAPLPGDTELERFNAMQAIERDIWLLNGGNGNRQGTLPQPAQR
jgi:hypothetical protein